MADGARPRQILDSHLDGAGNNNIIDISSLP